MPFVELFLIAVAVFAVASLALAADAVAGLVHRRQRR